MSNLDKIRVAKYRLTCKKCGTSWYSGTKATFETSCIKCRSYVRLPDELRALNASLQARSAPKTK